MTLILKHKSIYGNERFYPENETAKKLCILLKQITLTEMDIKDLKDIGFNVEIKTKEF